jgi:hemerythrin-like metal-binding protein
MQQGTDALFLDLSFMDQAHQQFLELLVAIAQADDRALPDAWRRLVECADIGFGRENAWMETTGFASRKAHIVQHRVVLEVMREGLVQAREGRLLQVREMASQFRSWYLKHVQSMDAGLALHLRSARFEPANGMDDAGLRTMPSMPAPAPAANEVAISP